MVISSCYYYYMASSLLGIIHTHSHLVLTNLNHHDDNLHVRDKERLVESVTRYILRGIPPFSICLSHINFF